ncbi:ras and EF-hand domain-containing protein isoform X2 [Nothobranchius furzeri]|uniref:RAS and EF-hand domain containing 2 n=2 Tax=Nothobranchius furzeri TaxID=105023 RepID=A0A1A8AQE8_NOTFU|nr:ras and EF-hand domain-containing protein isoform X2 [Nothobranchius furzeri]KAF7224469.1 transcript variant X2 [Nothobranchius furzeri]
MDRPSSLRRLFSACDVNKSGNIELEDFMAVCRELSVPETETQRLFEKFGACEDGLIDYERFCSKFQEVSETLDLASFYAGAPQTPWEEFMGRMDAADFLLSESLREQLADLYQAIHSSANTAFLQTYEEIIYSFASQSWENKLECDQLETSLKRAEDINSSQLAELEDDIQQQLGRTEERVRNEERKKMEGVMATMRRKHEDEVADLHATVDQLLKNQASSGLNESKEEVLKLNNQITDLLQQNEQLRGSLLQARTNISILHSELDKLKNMYTDQKAQHDRETEELKKMVVEYQSYASQIQILQEMNKKLYDSNDGLRSALAGQVVAAKRRLSPQNEIPARRMKPLRQSTLNHGRPEHDPSISRVAIWADQYLDSGLSLPMDTAESEYDSDDSRSSVETVHHSYSYVPSDVEISEVKSEAAVSVAPSRASSVASSLRRRLSAFSMKFEEDIAETKEPSPMYRVVLAGDAGAGKSSLLLRLTLNEFRGDIQTTLGVDFQMKRMLVDGETTSLQIWDTAGQERFRSIAKSYFRKAHGVLLLYDVTSESSFLNVRAWVDEIQESTDEVALCVVGNKVDLREQLPAGSCVSTSHGEQLAKAYGALFCETSAKDGTNVVEAVLHLAREVKKVGNLRCRSESRVKLNQTNPKKTFNSCCGR